MVVTDGLLRHRGCRRNGLNLICRHGDGERKYDTFIRAEYVDELVSAARRLLAATPFEPMKQDPKQVVAIIALEQVLDQFEGPPATP